GARAPPPHPARAWARENTRGRYPPPPAPPTPAAAATHPLPSSADPGTESLPPAHVPRLPAQLLAGLLVRGPARAGHLRRDELPGEQPPEPGGQAQRRLGARDLGQVRQPVDDRSRVVVHDVVDAGRAVVDRGERRRRG